MKDKLEQLMTTERNMPRIRFAELLDVQPATMSHILSNRNKPSRDLLIKILETFPNVSAEWLMRDKGEMLIDPKLTPMGVALDDIEFIGKERSVSSNDNQSQDANFVSRDLFNGGSIQSSKGNDSEERLSNTSGNGQTGGIRSRDVTGGQTARESNNCDSFPIKNFSANSQKGSPVERIVVFYADKSFETYLPKQ